MPGLKHLGKFGIWAEATRYWSLPAGAIPVTLTGVVLYAVEGLTFPPFTFLCVLFGVVFVHCGANLTNTYYDFQLGLDKKESADDRTLVDGLLTQEDVYNFSVGCYVAGMLCGVGLMFCQGFSALFLFLFGMGLAFGYSYTPVSFKNRGFGDVVIFLCFGPLLVSVASLSMVGYVPISVILFSLPPALITNGILHANNARDMESDKAAGATTLAVKIGLDDSFKVHIALLGIPYVICFFLFLLYSYSIVIILFSLPIAVDLVRDFKDFINKKRDAKLCMRLLPQKVAQFGLWFGLLLIGGVLDSKSLARCLLGLLFCLGGANNFYTFPLQARLVHNRVNLLTGVVDVQVPEAVTICMLAAASFIQITASMGFIANFNPVLCAWLMMLFLIGITPIVHNFWSYDPDPVTVTAENERLKNDGSLAAGYVPTFPTAFDQEFVQFWKNICIIGGLAVFLAYQQ